jgi:hypothetical protein
MRVCAALCYGRCSRGHAAAAGERPNGNGGRAGLPSGNGHDGAHTHFRQNKCEALLGPSRASSLPSPLEERPQEKAAASGEQAKSKRRIAIFYPATTLRFAKPVGESV